MSTAVHPRAGADQTDIPGIVRASVKLGILESIFVVVIGIVTGPPPQLKVTIPPPLRAWLSAASVQLAALPVPTTPKACTDAGMKARERATSERARMNGPPDG